MGSKYQWVKDGDGSEHRGSRRSSQEGSVGQSKDGIRSCAAPPGTWDRDESHGGQRDSHVSMRSGAP